MGALKPALLRSGTMFQLTSYDHMWHVSDDIVSGFHLLMCAPCTKYQRWQPVSLNTTVIVSGAAVCQDGEDDDAVQAKPIFLFPDGKLVTFMMRRFSMKAWECWRML
jgi:hypothetical protein